MTAPITDAWQYSSPPPPWTLDGDSAYIVPANLRVGQLWERVAERGEDLDIVNGYLVVNVGVHTCAGGTVESNYAHEPECGFQPLYEFESKRSPEDAEAAGKQAARVEVTCTHCGATIGSASTSKDGFTMFGLHLPYCKGVDHE